MVLTCLRGEHVSASPCPLGHLKAPTGLATPTALVVINHGASAQIAVYRDRVAAARVFSRQGADETLLLPGNAIIERPTFPPPPSSAATKALERCAFGVHSNPTPSPYYVASDAHPLTGHAVMLRSGCLACHQIGQAGNNGPGATSATSLHGCRPRRSPALSPIPPHRCPHTSRSSSPSDPDAWRALVSYLSRLKTG